MLFDILNKKEKCEKIVQTTNVEKKENTNIDEIAMGCCCEACTSPVDCSNVVTFTFQTCTSTTSVPPIGTIVPIAIVENNLRCVVERCFVDGAEIPDPCNPDNTFTCSVCLNRFRYIGCISFIANIPIPGTRLFSCFSGCELIDRIRCFNCADVCPTPPCPPAGGFIASGPTAVISALNRCPNTGLAVITVTVTLTLTSPCTNG